jgi:hypothetical protein
VTTQDLEARVKALEELVKSQSAEITTLKDIEKIKNLQKVYGYYLEHWMAQDIIDLFSDGEEVSLTLGMGTYLGKAGVRRYFEVLKPDNEFMHQVMQLSGIVNVDPDGKTAKGRWYGFGAISIKRGNGVGQSFMSGIYIAEYVKEDGIWKFKKLLFEQFYTAKPLEGWVKPERLATGHLEASDTNSNNNSPFRADIPRAYNPAYPSGYIVPFHFKHPVTGKKTAEDARNEQIKNSKDFLNTRIKIT